MWDGVPTLDPPGGVPEWSGYRHRNLVVSAPAGLDGEAVRIHAPDADSPLPAPACDTLLLSERGWNHFEVTPANFATLETCDCPACAVYFTEMERAFREAGHLDFESE